MSNICHTFLIYLLSQPIIIIHSIYMHRITCIITQYLIGYYL